MPEHESLEQFAKTRATLAIHLSIQALERVVEQLTPHYGPDCPVAVVYRASWPEQRIVRGTLDDIRARMQREGQGIDATALILVGAVLGADDFAESSLYNPDYQRRFRGRD
jgi:precorrin-4/cobalt-precorrin-4 C11-methyltransferase